VGGILPGPGPKVTQVSWFGYDATVDGDDLVVVVDEETTQMYDVIILGDDVRGAPGGAGAGAPAAGEMDFVPAEPPPLAPGLTEPVRAPDPLHRHQLRLMRLD
jgi:hypothetical protein